MKTITKNILIYGRLLCAASAIGLASQSASAAAFEYDYSFGQSGNHTFTNTPSVNGDYFYRADDIGDWNVTNGTLNSRWNTGENSFLIRQLSAGGTLPSGANITDPTMSIDSSWRFGDRNSTTLRTYMGLFDANGNGYLAVVEAGGATGTNGYMAFYQTSLDNLATASEWVLLRQSAIAYSKTNLLSKPNTGVKSNLHQILTFSIDGTTLTLATSADPAGGLSYTLGDSTSMYSEFTTIVIGGAQRWNETIYLDDLRVTGSYIPESSTTAFLFGIISVAAIILISRKHSKKA